VLKTTLKHIFTYVLIIVNLKKSQQCKYRFPHLPNFLTFQHYNNLPALQPYNGTTNRKTNLRFAFFMFSLQKIVA